MEKSPGASKDRCGTATPGTGLGDNNSTGGHHKLLSADGLIERVATLSAQGFMVGSIIGFIRVSNSAKGKSAKAQVAPILYEEMASVVMKTGIHIGLICGLFTGTSEAVAILRNAWNLQLAPGTAKQSSRNGSASGISGIYSYRAYDSINHMIGGAFTGFVSSIMSGLSISSTGGSSTSSHSGGLHSVAPIEGPKSWNVSIVDPQSNYNNLSSGSGGSGGGSNSTTGSSTNTGTGAASTVSGVGMRGLLRRMGRQTAVFGAFGYMYPIVAEMLDDQAEASKHTKALEVARATRHLPAPSGSHSSAHVADASSSSGRSSTSSGSSRTSDGEGDAGNRRITPRAGEQLVPALSRRTPETKSTLDQHKDYDRGNVKP